MNTSTVRDFPSAPWKRMRRKKIYLGTWIAVIVSTLLVGAIVCFVFSLLGKSKNGSADFNPTSLVAGITGKTPSNEDDDFKSNNLVAGTRCPCPYVVSYEVIHMIPYKLWGRGEKTAPGIKVIISGPAHMLKAVLTDPNGNSTWGRNGVMMPNSNIKVTETVNLEINPPKPGKWTLEVRDDDMGRVFWRKKIDLSLSQVTHLRPDSIAKAKKP